MSSVYFYYDPLAELDRLFHNPLSARFPPSTCTSVARATNSESFRPRMDLQESEEANTVTATFELPGLKSEDVTIDVHQNRLTVAGESTGSHSHEDGDGGYAVRERHYGKFSRTLRLPFGTKPEDVKAKMENGVLTVTFPKTTPEQRAQRIAVQ